MKADLLPHEKELIRLTAEGMKVYEISFELRMSVHYLEQVKQRLFNKTGTLNAPNLVSWAYKTGVLKI